MLFIVDPYAAEPEYLGPEDAYVEFKRRQYIAALEERQRRVQFERELEREEQRHRLVLASIARQEAERRRREKHYNIQRQRELQQLHQLATHEQAAQRQQQQREPEQQRPSQEEILNRRRKLQEEEETRSRDFHKHILSQIFGVPFDDQGDGTERAESTLARTKSSSTESTGANTKVDAASAKPAESLQATEATEPSQTTEDASEPPVDTYVDAHWSNAPERARALAEITSLGRVFAALKNTFVFPEGRLERLAGHDTPRLAYNSTNTAIHAYEHALSELLTKLDSIESHGFKGVREARKQLVISIEQELGALEEKIAERLASVDVASTPQEISIPVEDDSNRSGEPSKPQDAPTQDVVDEAPRDTAAEHDISLAVAEDVQDMTLEQKLTNSEMAGETATKVDDAVETREDEPLSDSRPIPEASVTDENPGVALDRNRDGEVAVTEHVLPAMPAGNVPHDEDSEVEDAVEVMLEPQRTAVPAGEEYEYELV